VRALVLGVGMQGRAALHDLATGGLFGEVVAADRDVAAVAAEVRARGYSTVSCRGLDATDPSALDRLVGEGFTVVVDLLPADLMGAVATAAVRHGAHVVHTMYVRPDLRALGPEAEAKGLAILPEFGMDPGIDLVMLGEAVRGLDEVTEVLSYGSGIPEPAAAEAPLRYKVSWSLEGMLRSYHRGARLLRSGAVVEIAPDAQFEPEHVHEVEVPGVGTLEAFPNGDAIRFLEEIGVDPSRVRDAGRYTLRYPGHCDFWRVVVRLGLLDDGPVAVDGLAVDRRRFLAAALAPRLAYREGERDLAILRVVVGGTRGGRARRVTYDLVDRKDLASGLSAMSRLTGFTASIGAQLIVRGEIAGRGLLAPAKDVPYAALVRELGRRGISLAVAEAAGG